MFRYTWDDGFSVQTNLSVQEFLKRYNRLDTLRVLTEGYDDLDGNEHPYTKICKKASKAENNLSNFTGIIRLSPTEKYYLEGMLDREFLTPEEEEVIRYYLRH